MLVLAIETSCDDTSLAVVSFDGQIFQSEGMFSYTQTIHQKYGGVVPEIASREHATQILLVLEQLVENWKPGTTSNTSPAYDKFFRSIDAIYYTVTPGLPGALIVGKTVALTLAQQYQKPIIPVNHIFGHICSLFLDRRLDEIIFPMAILTASGGHNDIYIVNREQGIENNNLTHNTQNLILHKIGTTLDDAAGECFDKVARMLGGPYPGGAWIGQQAESRRQRTVNSEQGIVNSEKSSNQSPQCEDKGENLTSPHVVRINEATQQAPTLGGGTKRPKNPTVHFPRIFLANTSFDFSFSGMKSCVHKLLADMQKEKKELTADLVAEIAREFQEAVVEVLAKKLVRAGLTYNIATLGIVGGVSCNERLREHLNELVENQGWIRNQKQGATNNEQGIVNSEQQPDGFKSKNYSIKNFHLLRPAKKLYSTDNGAMIGVAGMMGGVTL